MIIHGHYHRRCTDTMIFGRRSVRVEGVGRDGTWPGDGILVMDARLRILTTEEWAEVPSASMLWLSVPSDDRRVIV